MGKCRTPVDRSTVHDTRPGGNSLRTATPFRVLGCTTAWILLAGVAFGQFDSVGASSLDDPPDSELAFEAAEERSLPQLPRREEPWRPVPAEEIFTEEGAAPAVGLPSDASLRYEEWQLLPNDVMYPSYLAGEKEPRFQAVWLRGADGIWKWETALGGRVALLRHGTVNTARPEGWELQLEGAALARVQVFEPSAPLDATDYRVGFLSVWRDGPVAVKAGYYHLSSHAGDEYLIANPGYQRINYVRDSAILGTFIDLTDKIQVYGEVGYAGADGGAKPLEFQYGIQMSPQGPTGLKGKPFAAINGHTREDRGWITSVNMTAGWQWRGTSSNHLWRLGMQYYNGPSMQWEFVGRRESIGGGGIWYDF